MTAPLNVTSESNHKPGIYRWIIVSIVFLLLMGLSLFLSAGTISWTAAWFYLVLAAFIQVLDAIVLIPTSPELLGERSRPQAGAKKWDQVLSRLMAFFGPLTIWIVCGLDFRFRWSGEFGLWLSLLSALLVFLGSLIVLWAMAANQFFIGMVRIQEERGHIVVESGPYKYIRHPGYLGSLLYLFFSPLLLGSLWGLIPALLSCGVVCLRTYLEDQVLQAELGGYAVYSKRVTKKLIPGIW
jgi:protein-S-isoprenylcysteine O-methyltransferase Ste14